MLNCHNPGAGHPAFRSSRYCRGRRWRERQIPSRFPQWSVHAHCYGSLLYCLVSSQFSFIELISVFVAGRTLDLPRSSSSPSLINVQRDWQYCGQLKRRAIKTGTVPVGEAWAGARAGLGWDGDQPAAHFCTFLVGEFTRILAAQYSVVLIHGDLPFSSFDFSSLDLSSVFSMRLHNLQRDHRRLVGRG